MEFFRNTSMHGFRYLADRKINWLHKYAEIIDISLPIIRNNSIVSAIIISSCVGRSLSLRRLVLAVCLTAFIVWSVDLILLAWAAFNLNPIYVRLDSNVYPVSQVPFPGLAICPNNKLSKSATRQYAKLL